MVSWKDLIKYKHVLMLNVTKLELSISTSIANKAKEL